MSKALNTTATEVLHVSREEYIAKVTELRDAGFNMCVDVTAVDYLEHPGRELPEGMEPLRFEIVTNLLNMAEAARVRIRVQVPEDEPHIATLFPLYPGSEAFEREVFDMMGIVFDGHPDLTRILMPEDWEGHPLRKDFENPRVPVQFKAPRASK
jgi:NADH-quinone oxidoreductase subunit C